MMMIVSLTNIPAEYSSEIIGLTAFHECCLLRAGETFFCIPVISLLLKEVVTDIDR